MDSKRVNKVIFWMQEADELKAMAQMGGSNNGSILFRKKAQFRCYNSEWKSRGIITLTGVQEIALFGFLKEEEERMRNPLYRFIKCLKERFF